MLDGVVACSPTLTLGTPVVDHVFSVPLYGLDLRFTISWGLLLPIKLLFLIGAFVSVMSFLTATLKTWVACENCELISDLLLTVSQGVTTSDDIWFHVKFYFREFGLNFVVIPISTVVRLGFCTRDAFCSDYHHPTHNNKHKKENKKN